MVSEMTKSKHRIVWQKWQDPYGENLDDVEWPGWDAEAEDDTPDFLADEKSPVEQLLSEEELTTRQIIEEKPVKLIFTTLGMVPMTEASRPSKVFNFWVCHTSFNITDPLGLEIEKVDGVEILDVFTRYRFRVGIGQVFKPGAVMNAINERMLTHLDETERALGIFNETTEATT